MNFEINFYHVWEMAISVDCGNIFRKASKRLFLVEYFLTVAGFFGILLFVFTLILDGIFLFGSLVGWLVGWLVCWSVGCSG